MTTSFEQYTTAGERTIARKLVKAALDAGYSVSVNDGQEWTVKSAWRLKTVLDALATTGEDILHLRDAAGEPVGRFYLIWGNEDTGECLVYDHSANDICEALYNVAQPVDA